MKKYLIASIVFNVVIVAFLIGKRYYYAGNYAKISYDPWNEMRVSVYEDLFIDTSDIVFVGNSLTEGFPLTEMFGAHVKNRGIAGNITSNVLNRIESIAAKRPKKIFLEIGVNDFNASLAINTTFNQYIQIINKIADISPTIHIYVQSVFPTCMSYTKINDSITSLNSKLKGYCEKNGIEYIDIYSALLKNNLLDSSLTEDGIHLNGKGYDIWKKAIDRYVN